MTNHQRTILIAEDDENDIVLLRRAASDARIKENLIVTYDGYQAVDYLEGQPPYTDRKRHVLPGLIILDIKMRLMDGFEVLAWLKTRPNLADIPAVVLTGSTDQNDRKRALALGAKDYQVKPQKCSELAVVLSEWCNQFLSPRRAKKPAQVIEPERAILPFEPAVAN